MERRLKHETGSHLQRLKKVMTHIASNSLDGVILVPGPNLRYITGVNSLLLERPFLLFIPKDDSVHLVAPTLESGPYIRSPLKIVVHKWDDGEGPSHAFENVASQLPLNGRWGLEGRVPFRFINQIMKHAHPQLEDAEPVLQGIREIKELGETRLLQHAASILAKSFTKIPAMLKNGMTEMELARRISQTIYSCGAEFVEGILVQSGKFAADPHHLPSSRKLKRNESIVIDTACSFSGYYADITRTFIIGKDRKFEDLYGKVLASQRNAIKLSKGGTTVGAIDNAARTYLKEKGLDQYFIHRTGHGLGLEVHEAPYIIPGGNEVIKAGMVFTIEPGVYLPGKMGIRIEDDVLSTDRDCKNLTGTLPKEFEWWK